MKNYIKITLLLLLPTFLWAQGSFINNGATINIVANTNVRLMSSGVLSQANGNIVNNGNIYIQENWTQTGAGTNYSGAGWLWFDGYFDQIISSDSPLTIGKLGITNGYRVVLNSSINISGELDLAWSSSVGLGANNLVMNPGAVIKNYNEYSYIVTNGTGTLVQEVGTADVVFL